MALLEVVSSEVPLSRFVLNLITIVSINAHRSSQRYLFIITDVLLALCRWAS